MNAAQILHNLGQSLWLDNITRDLLDNGTLKRYIDELSITGLTSNPTIYARAIETTTAYDLAIRAARTRGLAEEDVFFNLALDDLTRAADLFRPIYERTNGVDGWVSLEVSPLLIHDAPRTLATAKVLFEKARRPNLFIKIPGTVEGVLAIEDAIAAGIPVNATLLFSREQYVAAANAYLKGIERRIATGLNPEVGSVASVFVSRWDVAVANTVPPALNNRLGIAVAGQVYRTYRELLTTPRWQRIFNAGARPQRLLWASTGTKDPKAADTLYVQLLSAPFTIDTMPEPTLVAFAEHGVVNDRVIIAGNDWETVLDEFVRAGVDLDNLAIRLQNEGASSFTKSWREILTVIAAKGSSLESQ